ncbi:hypothetical protein IRY55_01945 [Savagea sp. SN6]|uniref:ComN-like post-transcriptional regulator n=1 Tax=Savagea serpentis TaxID=2785297 RepID=A0A8J7KDJ4_9BACL|nr:post-transcriptional regulator [Savagea serpentis]MBF4500111.1 hypothetical protein [Savagea serpentis]
MKHKKLFKRLKPALTSKVEELQLNNYDAVPEEQLWDFCLKHVWKQADISNDHTHQLVADILGVTPAQFMTYTQVDHQQEELDWFSELNQEELQLLLKKEDDE